MKNINVTVSIFSAIASMGVKSFGITPLRSAPSDVQKRMHAAWITDAPRRNRLAAECSEWNKNVKRRNQRFVARQRARGRSAQ